MTFADHCLECRLKLGKEYQEVHEWLDEFAGKRGYGMRHRRVRHHEAGISEAISLFGEEGGEAARLHIISDLKEEGWSDQDAFPQNETDYVRMGFF